MNCSRFGFALIFLGAAISTAFAAPAAEHPAKRVLLISTGSRLSPGFGIVDQQILQALRTIESVRINAYAENLDIVRFPTEHSQRIFRDYLAARYAGQPPDLVVLVFVGSLGAAANSLAQVFPGTPIVVAGFTEEQIRPAQLGASVTGFVQRADAHAALDLILRLQPGLRRIVVIGGTSVGDRQKLQPVRAAAPAFAHRVAVEFWDNLAMAELRRSVTALPRDSAILYAPVFRDAAGETFVSAEVGRWIGQSASVPVYLLVDQSFGTGAVGGMISTVEAFGQRVGAQARRVLTGTPPQSMPFEVRSDSTPIFDWRALQRWNIGEELLPRGSVVRFKPPSLWREYGWYIGAALVIVVLQSATIVALVLQRRRRQRAEIEALQQRAALAHVARVSLMGELAASLAHELSQPLTAIFANAAAGSKALRQGQYDAAELADILDDVIKDQTRAAEVLRHMRRMVKKETELEFVTLDVGELAREVVALVRYEAALEHVEIDVDIEPALPPARGDRVQLQQVLLNLLLNALEAMKGGPRLGRTVALHARSKEGIVEVAVRDRGRGIAADDVERLFEPFYTTKGEGLGMGLSICRSIIRAHGGRLWAENNALRGATFYFTVPVRPA
jgi:signal transduction histidine kinase